MKNVTKSSCGTRRCANGAAIAIAAGVGSALSVSNGPAVGIAVGVGLGLVFWLRWR